MAQLIVRQRVAIAGTVTNADTDEGMPQVLVRITQAPLVFIGELMATLETEIEQHPELKTSYGHLFDGRPITPDTLKTAQILLDAFERNRWLSTPRTDQIVTGGDGHYCFFDLASGLYRLTATYLVPNRCYGSTQGQVLVERSSLRLAFSELDLSMSLVPSPLAIPAQMPAAMLDDLSVALISPN
ncbi:MAG: hypothetical protein HC929_07780 [Leptolyngbyaceae cyanobacterium SM2_5_2]|nr:hypothetical protein [Leptolyngbyaceae cyanobacterium SM2_5_2]